MSNNTLRVPKRAAEKPNQRRVFPRGTYQVTLEQVASKEPPSFMYTQKEGSKRPRVGADGEQTGIQFGQAVSLLEGQEDAGNQKLFLDLITRDSGQRIDKLNFKQTDGLGWGILRDAAALVNLARALGQTYDEGEDTVLADDFLDNLREGMFNNFKVIVEVEHEAWANAKTGKSGVNLNIVAFSPAA